MNRKPVKILFGIVVLPCVLAFVSVSKMKEPQNIAVEFFMSEYQKDFHPDLSFSNLIFVSIKNQKLYYLQAGEVTAKFDVSTSKYGVGTQMSSQKTPVGLHQIKFKLGAGTPVNGVIKSGYYTGRQAENKTSRIDGYSRLY